MRTRLSVLLSAGAIDREAGVIRGCSVITEGPALGHGFMIDRTTLDTVLGCAKKIGNVKVKADHWGGVSQIIAYFEGSALAIDDARGRVAGDMYVLANSPMYEFVFDLVEKLASNIGLSINFDNVPEDIGGVMYARCGRLYSIDLVTDPAANAGGLLSEGTVDMRRGAMSKFAGILNGRITALAVGDKTRDAVIAGAAEKSKLSVGVLGAILTGSSICPTRDGAKALATELGIPEADLFAAAREDGFWVEVPESGTQLTAITGERDQLKGQLATITTERDQLKGQLATITTERDQLKANAKTAEQLAAEQLAGRGVPPVQKPAPGAPTPEDGKTLFERYNKLDGREAAEFWATHEKALLEYSRTPEAQKPA